MDKDADGFIAGAEIPLGTRGVVGHRQDESASQLLWLATLDVNNDRKADWQEFSGWLLPVISVANCLRG